MRKRGFGWGCGVLAPLLVSALCWPAGATSSAASGPRIALFAERYGSGSDPVGLWILEGGRVRLVGPEFDNRWIWQGAWSPDGSRLLVSYGYNSGPQKDIAIVDPDAGDAAIPVSIAGNGYAGNPAWSPDGSRIAWNDHGAATLNAVWTASADGSGAHEVPSTDKYYVMGFTPNSARLFVLRYTGAADSVGTGLGTIALDGTGYAPIGPADLATHPTYITHASMSPDGARVAYSTQNGCSARVHVRRTDGGGAQVLDIGTTERLDGVDWTADGGRVIFAGSRPCTDPQRYSRIWEANLQGAPPRQLTFSTGYPGANQVRPAIHGSGSVMSESTSTPTTSTTTTATQPAPNASTATTVSKRPAASDPVARPTGAGSDQAAPTAAAPRRPVPDLGAEDARLLAKASAALRRGDADTAQRLLQEISRRNPRVEIEELADAIGLPAGTLRSEETTSSQWALAAAILVALGWLATGRTFLAHRRRW